MVSVTGPGQVPALPSADEVMSRTAAAFGGEDGLLRWTVARALEQAAAGELPFAALVVRDGHVVGVGVNTTRHDLDLAAHAEVNAIRSASEDLGRFDLDSTLVYSNAEPCSICRTVAHAAGVRQLVFATPRQIVEEAFGPMRLDAVRLRDAVHGALPDQIRLGSTGLTSDALREPYDTYVRRIAHGDPSVVTP